MRHTFIHEGCECCGGAVLFTTDAAQACGDMCEEGSECAWHAFDGDEGKCEECGAPHHISADAEGAEVMRGEDMPCSCDEVAP